jgi:hypothetical protein
MAKADKAAAATPSLAQIEVRHHCSPDKSPSQGEILVGGLRVAYISYAAPHPISFLSPKYLANATRGAVSKLEADEIEQIATEARKQVAELAQVEAGQADRLTKLLSGE